MFDFLDDKSTDDVVEAAYFAARLIVNRDSIDDYMTAAPVKGIRSEPSSKQAALGRKIIHEIIEREQTDLDELSAAAASNSLSDLWDLVERRISRDTGPASVKRAERVLKKWRASARRVAATT